MHSSYNQKNFPDCPIVAVIRSEAFKLNLALTSSQRSNRVTKSKKSANSRNTETTGTQDECVGLSQATRVLAAEFPLSLRLGTGRPQESHIRKSFKTSGESFLGYEEPQVGRASERATNSRDPAQEERVYLSLYILLNVFHIQVSQTGPVKFSRMVIPFSAAVYP